jgi:hypothetical protein
MERSFRQAELNSILVGRLILDDRPSASQHLRYKLTSFKIKLTAAKTSIIKN